MIYSKLKALEWSQHFSDYKSMGIIKRLKGSYLHSQMSHLAEFRSQPSFMVVLVACKNEDQIKNEGARVVTLSINI